jgi:hypothetical protein
LEHERAFADNPATLKDYFAKVLAPFVQLIANLIHNGSREWVIVIEGVSAAGKALPLMIINKEEAHYKGWYANLKSHDIETFSYSPKGWSDRELGIKWLVDNFHKYMEEE